MKKKTIVIIVGVVVVAGVILGVMLFGKGKNDVIKYRKEALSRGDIEALVVTSGTLNPIEIVEVGAQVSGKVEKLYVDFNSQVTRGQIVAELDQEPLKMKIDQNEASYRSRLASLERAKVTLDTSEKKYERSKALFEKALISIEEMDAAEAAYLGAKTDLILAEASLAQAKSTLDLSKVDLSYSVIRAPVDGVVISRKVNVGQTVQSSFQAPVLFEIATDLTKMKVECSVDESDIGKVKEGQKARFTVEAYPNETFEGVVQQVRFSPETVQNVVTYTTIVNLENPQKKLFPGMTATVSMIVGEAKDSLRVPNAALRFTPTLTTEEMEKMVQELRDRMTANRQGQEGQPGASGPGAGQQQSRPRGEGRPQGQGGSFAAAAGLAASGAGPSGRTRQQIPRVWTLGPDGKLSMHFLRTGVTDNSYTEILRSELKEGDEVLIGTDTTTAQASSASQRGMQMMFMGGPPRR